MRCHLVTLSVGKEIVRFRYAATNAEARTIKQEFCDEFNLGPRTKDVAVIQTNIDAGKDELLEFINDMAERLDKKVGE